MVKATADELCGQSLNMPIKCPLHYSKSKGGFNDTTKARLQFTLTRRLRWTTNRSLKPGATV